MLDFKIISTLYIHPILFNPTAEWESYRKTAAFTTLISQESVIKSHFCGSTLQHVGVLLTEHKRRTTAAFPAARANDTTVITAWFLHLITIICANNYLKLRVKKTLCCSFRIVNCTSKYFNSIRGNHFKKKKKKSPPLLEMIWSLVRFSHNLVCVGKYDCVITWIHPRF